MLRKDEDNALQFSCAINRRRCCVHDASDGHDEDAAGERGCIASEQERMHEALVASQARNEELNRINEELRKALQEREKRAAGDRSAPPSPPCSFPMPFS